MATTFNDYLVHASNTDTHGFVAGIVGGLDECFTAGFKLSTGLGMEALWKILRPVPIQNEHVFKQLVQIEDLAAQFDQLKWKSTGSVTDLANTMESFAQAYRLVRLGEANTDGLFQPLKTEIERMRICYADSNDPITPFFATEFEAVQQFTTIDGISKRGGYLPAINEIVSLSGTQLVTLLRVNSATDTSKLLQMIETLVRVDHQSPQWREILSTKLLQKLNNIGSNPLRRLKSLETELPLIAREASRHSDTLTGNHFEKLNQVLWHLMINTLNACDPHLTEIFTAVRDSPANSSTLDFVQLSKDGLSFKVEDFMPKTIAGHLKGPFVTVSKHIIAALVSSKAHQATGYTECIYLANAWIQFSLALAKLYIPDKVFDPQLRPLVELRSYDELFEDMNNQLGALEEYGRLRTGQSANLRSDILRDEISTIGGRPIAVPVAYRPNTSGLAKMQAEFNNILGVLLGSDLGSTLFRQFFGSDAAAQELQVVYENLSRVSSRLIHSFRAYEDIMLPTVNILHCLTIGISLGKEATLHSRRQSSSTTGILALVPFVGGKPGSPIPQPFESLGSEFLKYAGVVRSIEGLDGIREIRQSIFEVIHSFYGQWTQKLEEDRKAEEVKNSLFRYRGGQDEEEAAEQAAFNELFPGFSDQSEAQNLPEPPRINNAREMAIRVARVHKAIFLNPQNTSASLKSLILHVAENAHRTAMHGTKDRDLFSATLFALEGEVKNLMATTTLSNYNFYTDPNIPEARKLASLVTDIYAHFRQLQQVDEIGHLQPLADVVSACDTIFDIGHAEPLSQVIPRVEHLHSFVYEWQFGGWASKTYGALSLYTRLTDTLVSWRRLELSTWNKLFDMEIAKCNDDADSWWFIAYQAIIAATMSLSQIAEETKTHASNLMKELESYFSLAPIGQFAGRLSLLTQLHVQLTLLVLDFPALVIIRDSLGNFVEFYTRYSKPVDDLLRSGRAPIEKQMKDVVLLASWKDTNIAALRESARRSHQKLFRLVRKFRDVLNQPMKLVIDQGLPDESKEDTIALNISQNSLPIDMGALDVCSKSIPAWADQYRRLANVQRTVELMGKLGRTPESTVNPASIIADFLSDLETQMGELRKETPSTLKDENKDIVKHLKTRKRKLFAETLKTVRQMGFSYNLGLDALAKQDSLSTVFASTAPLPNCLTGLDAIEYYLHKTLDLAPRIRGTSQTHSEDLTAAEITRSIGLLEGILYNTLRQRGELRAAVNALTSLKQSSNLLQSLVKTRNRSTVQVGRITGSVRRAPAWLAEILSVGIQLVELHGRFGDLDNIKVLDLLNLWRERTITLSTKMESLVSLPVDLITAEHFQVAQEIEASFNEFHNCLHVACLERPDLGFIFEQIQNWATIPAESDSVPEAGRRDIDDLVQSVKKLCDSILVAVEQFNKAGTKFLNSTEEASWLVRYNEQLASSVQVLHMTQIEGSTREVLDISSLMDWSDSTVGALAPSLLATLAPIVHQYEMICTQFTLTFANSHRMTCKLGFTLSKHFAQLASQGFCSPQEKSEESAGQSESLEGGTGLGDGEGAEDISKDIQPDEDLSELAQEKNADPGREMEDEKDAVDMADEDLEGDTNSVEGEEDDKASNSDDDETKDELDEERGDVDDLDPTAVDEKMWDGENEDEAEKDQKGEKPKGQKKDEETAAGEQPETQDIQPDEGERGDDNEDEEAGVEMEEDIQPHEEPNQQDQNVQDQDTLALPDDMEIDGKDDDSLSSISDDELDELSDVDQQEKDETTLGEKDGEQDSEEDGETEMETGPIEDSKDDEMEQDPEDDIQLQGDEGVQENDPETMEEMDKADEAPKDDSKASNDHVVPSDSRGGGEDQDIDQGEEHDHSQDSAAQKEAGQAGENAPDQDKSEGHQGSVSQSRDLPLETGDDDATEATDSNPFKALGDALEKWHRRQREIKAAQENQVQQQLNDERDSKIHEFQHLENDETAADAQAMGTATEEQSRPLDDAMAIDDDEDQPPSNQILPEDSATQAEEDVDEIDTSKAEEQQNKRDAQREERDAGVTTHQGAYNRNGTPPPNSELMSEEIEDTIQETSTQLSSTHLEPELQLRDYEEAMQQWTDFQTKTHPLSLSLTSQLRLILTPSQSTKLSGSYRTGKRLNIKRIIPYIASSYKRDKIWMRRAIPTKRSYQILLCVDDSKSMGESSSGELALESLVMVSRALTMLEVGQIGVLGFGANAFMAHEFSEPFASHDAGAKVLQRFTFQQDYTNIQFLVRQTIERFRLARQQSTSRGSEDLWQLALILSDGLTPSSEHENIQVLLREAIEERIMIVFIIMDDTTQKKEQSVLRLKKVKFLGNDEIKTEYYLDTFPFQYYLVVHNLEDLPGALAGLLRTWFAEVNS